MGGINYPLLSDFWPHGEVAEKYGVFRKGKSERAIFIIDKEGIIRYIDIHDIDEQPSNEVVRQELLKITPKDDVKTIKPSMAESDELLEGGIIMYCTPWCPECHKGTQVVYGEYSEFTDVDITKSQALPKV